MAYTRFSNGFDITSNSAVDKRLSLTKAQMLTAEDDFNLPDVYFCICPDDGKLYLFNVNNTPSNATGKFRQIDETLNYQTSEAQQQLNTALNNSSVIQNIDADITEVEVKTDINTDAIDILNGDATVDGSVEKKIKDVVEVLTVDGGKVE